MRIVNVPVFNDDGSIKYEAVITSEEAQLLLQFSMNYLMGAGLSLQNFFKMMREANNEEDETPEKTAIN